MNFDPFPSNQSSVDFLEQQISSSHQVSSSESNDLLRTLVPSADTIKHYLCDSDEQTVYQSANTNYPITLTELVNLSTTIGPTYYSSNYDDYSFQANSFNLNQDAPEYNNVSSTKSYLPTNYSQNVQPYYQSNINDGSNNSLTTYSNNQYRSTLTLNTDNSSVFEPWNANVAQKILAVYFSSLSLKSEFLSNQVNLDCFEHLFMNEATSAFQGHKRFRLTLDLSFTNLNIDPNQLLSICNRIKGFRKLETCDKIILLSSTYFDVFMMKGIINYDQTIDGWQYPEYGFRYNRRDLFNYNQTAHDSMAQIIETFPDQWRNDLKVIALIYLIIIFNPDLPDLSHPEIAKHEQFTYIYLLGRYLRTVCRSDCEAANNQYRLLAKIEQVKLSRKELMNNYEPQIKPFLMQSISNVIALHG